MNICNPIRKAVAFEAAHRAEADMVIPTLVIGDIGHFANNDPDAPTLEGLHFADIAAVNTNLLQEISPSIILSPLIANDFDAIDVARSLVAVGFSGRYCAVTEHLPNTRLVLQEIKSAAPGLEVELFVLPPRAAND